MFKSGFIYYTLMWSKLKFLFYYFLSWVVLFELLRVVFLVYHSGKTRDLPFSTVLATCWYGLRMDISTAAYIILPVGLFVLLSLVIPFFRRLLIYKIYTAILLFLVLLISISDLEIYNAWGFRLDATPLRFLSTPREAVASMSHLPLLFIGVVFLVFLVALTLAFNFILRRIFFVQQANHKVLTAVIVLACMAGMIIPIRGGLQLAPLNQSSVYFSKSSFANHAAINASWNLLHSVLSKENSHTNPYNYYTTEKDKQIVDSLYSGVSNTDRLINFSDSTNIIFVIWESFTEKATQVSIDGKAVTPQFNLLKQEGVYFSNVYASGDRTNKGLPAILSGYPAMPATTIIHSPGKSAKLSVLSQLFKQKGYATPFFYGGEPEFANIKSYLLHGGFDPIVGKDDFESRDMNSKWGAHDGVVMKRVVADLKKTKQPFFATWLTLTSHEPFETPVPVVFKGNSITLKFLNSQHYTDSVVAELVRQCSQESWWNRTVMIIIGDHGHPLPETKSKADDFRTPMLWLGGAVNRKGVVFSKVVSQLDIATMLIKQSGIDTTIFPFSKNMLDEEVKPWAFFTFNNGFGFVDSSGRVLFDNVGKRVIQKEGTLDSAGIVAGKAMMQFTYQDFINK